ncbi:unnamed protein product [Brassicogethes aeneus]|uniref:Uncharacterized protein n=1 Tax=Brassicogethes aeneus TaxID=1431903 RepID=A0A9P0BBX2_BRAAE|nr:unnamed protein product [Brassicogethes aeneus]
MADKAVSTEDLCVKETPEERALGVVRLEAILHTLFENKNRKIKTTELRTKENLEVLQTAKKFDIPYTVLDRMALIGPKVGNAPAKKQKKKKKIPRLKEVLCPMGQSARMAHVPAA